MKPIYLILIIFLFSFSLFAQSNWRQVNSGTNEFISSIQFEDSLVGYATAGNQILKSTDAGENWTLFYQDTSINEYRAITFVKDSLFVIGRENSNNVTVSFIEIINKSNKQSAKLILGRFDPSDYSGIKSFGDFVWYKDEFGVMEYRNGSITSVHDGSEIFRYQNGYFVGVNRLGSIYLTNDTGATWDTIPTPAFTMSGASCYFNGSDSLLVYNTSFPTHFVLSSDRGVNWQNVSQTRELSFSAQFVNSKKAFGAFVASGSINLGIAFVTYDGGENLVFDTLGTERLPYTYSFSPKLSFVYGAGGSIFKTTNLGGLVSINENKGFNESDFTIFPNPSQDYLQIKLADNDRFSIKQMTILSANGAVLATFQSFQERIELSTYPKGMYIIQLQTDKGSASKSFVVK